MACAAGYLSETVKSYLQSRYRLDHLTSVRKLESLAVDRSRLAVERIRRLREIRRHFRLPSDLLVDEIHDARRLRLARNIKKLLVESLVARRTNPRNIGFNVCATSDRLDGVAGRRNVDGIGRELCENGLS